jgi:uncharacterized protein
MALLKKSGRRAAPRSKKTVAEPKPGTPGLNPVVFTLFGAAFGYFLSKSGLTDYNRILNMFLFKDLPLYLVIALAVLLVYGGLLLMEKRGITTLMDEPVKVKKAPFQKERLVGAVLFGMGWVLAGACPATALAQLGEGKLMALVTLLGILAGVWAYGKWMSADQDPND